MKRIAYSSMVYKRRDIILVDRSKVCLRDIFNRKLILNFNTNYLSNLSRSLDHIDRNIDNTKLLFTNSTAKIRVGLLYRAYVRDRIRGSNKRRALA